MKYVKSLSILFAISLFAAAFLQANPLYAQTVTVGLGEGGIQLGAGATNATKDNLVAENGNLWGVSNALLRQGLRHFVYSDLAGTTLPSTIQAGTYTFEARIGNGNAFAFSGLNDLTSGTNTGAGSVAGFFSTFYDTSTGTTAAARTNAENTKNNMYTEFNAIPGVTYIAPTEEAPADLGWTTWTFTWVVAPGSSVIGTDPYFGVYTSTGGSGSAFWDDSTLSYSSEGITLGPAGGPSPINSATDVPYNTVLTWEPGPYPGTHRVYFGTDFNDVNDANDATPASSVYVDERAENSYDPGNLKFKETYFWRIDEVNEAPDNTVFKGNVWSFEVEPEGLPYTQLTATASSQYSPEEDPNNTINGVGLHEDGSHDTDRTTMWLCASSDPSPWIRYDLSEPQKLSEMLVWNHNTQSEEDLGYGIMEAQIWVSRDGIDFTDLGIVTLAQSAETAVDLRGAVAQSVKITVVSNYGGSKSGLSEVRLYAIPTGARELSPADGAADVDPATVVLTWRAGREAVAHNLYLGTDEQAVIDGTAAIITVPAASYTPDLELGKTYYWRVDEVNNVEDPSVWAGSVQSFTTPGSIVVDDMESYKNQEGFYIFEAWVDGYQINDNGSLVGVGADFEAEKTIVYGGSQSLPMTYGDLGIADSWATRAIETPKDWSKYGVKSLSLWIYGQADNVGGQLYVKVNDTRFDYQGAATDIQAAHWFPFTIDLTGVTEVDSLTIGVEGGSGMIYIDDIYLTPSASELITGAAPSDDDPNLVAHYAFEGNPDDSKGNYPGTAVGDPVYATGKYGQALDLDGVDDHIENIFDQNDVWPAYSVSLWVKTDVFGQVIHSGLFNNNSDGADFQIAVNGSDGYEYRGAAIGQMGPVSSDWVHLTVSCDGTQTDLYYNGVYVRTVNEARVDFGQIVVGNNRGMTVRFAGTIDDVRVYDRALSYAEALGLAERTEPAYK